MKIKIFVLFIENTVAAVSLWKPSSEYTNGFWKEVEVVLPEEITCAYPKQ